MITSNTTLGLSAYSQHNSVQAGRRVDSYQPYLKIVLPYDLSFAAEYQYQNRFDASVQDVRTWYSSLKWQFNDKSYLYYRYDKGDDETQGASIKTTRNIVTLGYWPKSYVRTKLELSRFEFNDPSVEAFTRWSAWIGIKF